MTGAVPDVLHIGETTICVPRTWLLTAKREKKGNPALMYGFLPEEWVRAIGVETHFPPGTFFLFRADAEDKKLGVLITELEPDYASKLSRLVKIVGQRTDVNSNVLNGCSLENITVSGLTGITIRCPAQNNNGLKTIEFPSLRLVVSVPASELHLFNEMRFNCH